MTGRFLERVVTAILLALPVASLSWMALQWLNYGLDLPYYDDWRSYFSGTIASLDVNWLFQPANDTIYAVGKFSDAIGFRLLRGNNVAYQFLSMVIVLGSLLALQWHLLKVAVADRLMCAAAFSLMIFMIQPGSYWGQQNLAYHQALPLIFILASIYILSAATWHWSVRAAVLFVLGTLSGLSYISGAFGILALALTLLACIAINRNAWRGLVPDAVALSLAGALTTAVQAWVILFRQNGQIHTKTPWSLPTDLEFWMYLFGKIGRSLLLPRDMPLLSVIAVVVLFLAAIWVAAISLRNVAIASDRHSASARVGMTTLLLLASVFCYLLMVTAGRADLRSAAITKPLEIFSYGFLRFHFFWATLIWPWVFVGLTALWTKKRPAHRRVVVAAAGIVMVFAVTQGALGHKSFFKRTAADSQRNAECLLDQVMAGGTIDCPRLYPAEMARAYANSVAMDASFVRYFPPGLLGARGTAPGVDILRESDASYAVRNATFTVGGSRELRLDKGHDVQIPFTLKDPELLQNCLAVKVTAQIETERSTFVQLFYQPPDSPGFSEANSERIGLEAKSRTPLELIAVSPKGFKNNFRLDPAAHPRSAIIRTLKVKCVLRHKR